MKTYNTRYEIGISKSGNTYYRFLNTKEGPLNLRKENINSNTIDYSNHYDETIILTRGTVNKAGDFVPVKFTEIITWYPLYNDYTLIKTFSYDMKIISREELNRGDISNNF